MKFQEVLQIETVFRDTKTLANLSTYSKYLCLIFSYLAQMYDTLRLITSFHGQDNINFNITLRTYTLRRIV